MLRCPSLWLKILLGFGAAGFILAAYCSMLVSREVDRGALEDRGLCDSGNLFRTEARGRVTQSLIDHALLKELQVDETPGRALSNSRFQMRGFALLIGLKIMYSRHDRQRMYRALRLNMRFCPGARERLLQDGFVLPN